MGETPSINLLSPVPNDTVPGKKRRRWRRVLMVVVLSLAITVTAYSGVKAPVESLGEIRGPLSFIAHVSRLVVSAEKPLAGSNDDRVNVLLLGMGGAGHDGPLLTDTIMVLSVKPSTNQAALISIPRDLLVEIPGYGWRRINSINAYAEQDTPGKGGDVTAQAIGKMLNLDIPYYVRIDFRGFEKLIDELGGVTVTVDRSFSDPLYPTADDEVQTISFSAGKQKMDGKTALVFARSRHGSNGEGSDFARSRRQQKILLAVKEALLSAGTLTNPGRITSIAELLRTHISTNVEAWQMLRLADIGSKIDTNKLGHLVFDDAPNGLLTAAVVDGAFVLVPRGNDYSLLAGAAGRVFDAAAEQADTAAALEGGGIRLEIQNGTRREGFAGETADALQTAGFTVATYGNAAKQNYERTVIYDLSDGQHPEALRQLQNQLSADISVSLPGWILSASVPNQITLSPPTPTGTNVDFLIILGNSSVPPT